MKIIASILLLAFVCLAGCQSSPLPKDLHERPGGGWLVLERKFCTPLEARMIDAAERAMPARQQVHEAMQTATYKIVGAVPEEQFWYYSQCERLLLPYCLSRSAVDYYVRQARQDKDQPKLLYMATASYWPVFRLSDSYLYWLEGNVLVQPSGREDPPDDQEYSDVYVVQMLLRGRLSWTAERKILIMKSRVVVLDKTGKVLAVYGDGGDRNTLTMVE